jgi:hypothetical protein
MTNNIGLWIDHKKAILVIQSEKGEKIQKIESGVERRIPDRGASHPRSRYSAEHQQGDDQLDNKFAEQINKFYDKIISELRRTEAVLIFGPGEAKGELEKRVTRGKIKVRIAGVETADKMTDRQIASKVRKFFNRPIH